MNNEIVKENLIKMVKREKNITFIEIERYFVSVTVMRVIRN